MDVVMDGVRSSYSVTAKPEEILVHSRHFGEVSVLRIPKLFRAKTVCFPLRGCGCVATVVLISPLFIFSSLPSNG